jgi:hypothetical protein
VRKGVVKPVVEHAVDRAIEKGKKTRCRPAARGAPANTAEAIAMLDAQFPGFARRNGVSSSPSTNIGVPFELRFTA